MQTISTVKYGLCTGYAGKQIPHQKLQGTDTITKSQDAAFEREERVFSGARRHQERSLHRSDKIMPSLAASAGVLLTKNTLGEKIGQEVFSSRSRRELASWAGEKIGETLPGLRVPVVASPLGYDVREREGVLIAQRHAEQVHQQRGPTTVVDRERPVVRQEAHLDAIAVHVDDLGIGAVLRPPGASNLRICGAEATDDLENRAFWAETRVPTTEVRGNDG